MEEDNNNDPIKKYESILFKKHDSKHELSPEAILAWVLIVPLITIVTLILFEFYPEKIYSFIRIFSKNF